MPGLDPLTAVLNIGEALIDKLIPDKNKAAQAKFKLAQLSQSGDLKELEIGMSAIIAEAQSADPWTSRARPSFMYVMYVMILSAIPMGVLSAFSPETAQAIINGMKMWLEAIPKEMWALFGVGYTGYAVVRSYDKGKLKKE
ncbi:MAG TPA: hypothetical protein ENH62_14860 [Marinobacter sp.]|uniref:Holin of 3TMs, for gene-transfer release n=1 Tax=marine sediment metagenome TaxID=412755 RepID=A0A0F9NY27_9ZZZZ|nr:hypothetical protein [Marinobacter sp.]